MKIIAFLNQKGGVGKTTLATNIARAIQTDGHNVLLVDSDPQGSARDWRAANEDHSLPVVGLDRKTLDKDIRAVSKGYDYIVIDGAPQLAELSAAAIKCADLVLIPVQPSPYDVWACGDLIDLLKARQEVTDGKPKAGFVISRVIKHTQLSRDVVEALGDYGLPVLDETVGQRQAYPKTAAQGLTVIDTDPEGDAALEVKRLVKRIQEWL